MPDLTRRSWFKRLAAGAVALLSLPSWLRGKTKRDVFLNHRMEFREHEWPILDLDSLVIAKSWKGQIGTKGRALIPPEYARYLENEALTGWTGGRPTKGGMVAVRNVERGLVPPGFTFPIADDDPIPDGWEKVQ